MADAFESLARSVIPLRPRDDFATELRGQLVRIIDDIEGAPMSSTARTRRPLLPAMTYIGSAAPTRTAQFFAALFDWEAEDVGGTYYVFNVEREPSVRTGHRGQPMPVISPGAQGAASLQFAVEDFTTVLATLRANGGTVVDHRAGADYAGVAAPDGTTFVLWQSPPPGTYPTPPPRRLAAAVPGYFHIETPSPDRAAAFYETVLGWEPVVSGDDYRVVDSGRVVVTITHGPARLRSYLAVEDLDEVLLDVERVGGNIEARYELTGRAAADCADPIGAVFRLIER